MILLNHKYSDSYPKIDWHKTKLFQVYNAFSILHQQ